MHKKRRIPLTPQIFTKPFASIREEGRHPVTWVRDWIYLSHKSRGFTGPFFGLVEHKKISELMFGKYTNRQLEEVWN